MDLTTVIVLAVTAIVVVVLVFFERDSRRNDAKLKAELAGNPIQLLSRVPRLLRRPSAGYRGKRSDFGPKLLRGL